MEVVGIAHNESLRFILPEVNNNFNNVIKVKEVVVPFLNSPEVKEITKENVRIEKDDVPFPNVETIDDLDFESWMNDLEVSPKLKVLTTEILTILQSNNLNQIKSEIKAKEKNASSLGLSDDELKIYYAHLAVAKYSAEFWLPEFMGGENGF